jgi:dextranase
MSSLIPERTTHAPGHDVRLRVDTATAHRVLVHHLDRLVADVPVDGGVAVIPAPPVGGYGATAVDAEGSLVARTAFDVLADPFDRPRYGFVTRMDDSAVLDDLSLLYRRLHLSIAQFYDWAYRHSTLLPPADDYLDPLGQPRSLRVIDEIAGGLSGLGTVPLGYSAVYAIGSDETERWASQLLRREDGEPYRLGDDFLVLVDPGDPQWLAHYTDQLRQVLERTRLKGFHLDQYGWPKYARSGGRRVDVAASFVTMLGAVREATPDARFMFNNVNDFGTRQTARTAQDASYIEVWSPHDTLQDLADLVSRTRALRPDHPPIISAYLSCFADGEAGGVEAAHCAMAAIFAGGGTHLLLGDVSNALTDPYYPRNAHLTPAAVDALVPWYDFLVRYGDLLLPADVTEVTEFYAGGINEDVVITAGEHRVTTQAAPDSLWVRVFRTGDGSHIVHVVNLLGTDEIDWDRTKPPVTRLEGATLTVASGLAPAGAAWATPDDPDLHPLAGRDVGSAAQSDALSAGQEHREFALPPLGRWTLLWIPATDHQETRR